MKFRICAAILFATSSPALFCQSVPPPTPISAAPAPANPGPVQAEFLAPINVRRLESGKSVLARVTLDWNGPDCTLRSGAILQATVEDVETRKVRGESRLALSFTDAQCDGKELKPMNLLLAAVAEPPEDWTQVPHTEFRAPVMALDAGGHEVAGYGGTGISGFDVTQMELAGITHHFPMSRDIQPGDVVNIKGIKLDLGTGPNRSSVLHSTKREIALDEYTQILLVPSAMVFSKGPTSLVPPDTTEAAVPRAPVAPPPPPPPVNDLTVCAPPGCAVDVSITPEELTGASATSIAIRPIGYAPRPQRELEDFGDDESLIWLDSKHLLFAFNVHGLIRRGSTPTPAATRRIVRAALINAETHAVTRAVDWEITDNRRFIWPLGQKRILVHVGNELRVYGEGLDVERTISLTGPLAFVRISPNGELMAIATLIERHSAELHAKLRDDLGGEPDEDVEVTVLGKNFDAIAHASTVSGLQPPTLLNEGQAKLFAQPNMHYRLTLGSWDGKTTTLARFVSRCPPELSSVAPDLLFMLSCNVATGAFEYRVLDADGKLLLRGEAGPREFGYVVRGGEANGIFAMKVVHATRELGPGMEFKVGDLESEEVRVYRVTDGKRLLVARVNEPVPSHDTYALSPDGGQLAVLSNAEIQFFPLPVK
jgi:hypothetical protein